jgi:hypothetical protein
MYALLPFLHKIYLTAAKSNIKSLVSLLEYFKHDKAEKQALVNIFRANKTPYSHFCLDINQRTVTLVGPDDVEGQVTNMDLAAADTLPLADSLLSELANPGKAKAVYTLISKRLDNINQDDLTLSLKSAKTGKPVVINLVDYLDCVTTPGKTPDRLMLFFHSYIVNRVQIPRCFILNKSMH